MEDIYQACELLFGRDLLDENKDYTEKTEPLSRLIQRRIEGRADSERKVFGIFPLLNREKRAFFRFSFSIISKSDCSDKFCEQVLAIYSLLRSF